MPKRWIHRTLEEILREPPAALRLFPVWLILGPRQVGKSSTLLRCKEPKRSYINLDDFSQRTRAYEDPEFFMQDVTTPFIVDEIQYAPQLLSFIKQIADKEKKPGIVWITGSQSFDVMKGVQESLAGRVAILNLFGLSDTEKKLRSSSPTVFFDRLMQTTFPRLHSVDDVDARNLYLSSYVQTYIERDVRELLGIQKRREFELLLQMCSLRTGQIVNYDDLAGDVGVSAHTVKDWIGLLEDSFILKMVQPYFSNRSKRLIKSPKLYFLDMGLAAYLAGWRDSTMLRLGPMAGAAFETHIYGSLLRYFKHQAKDVQFFFWKDRDGREIDFLVEFRSRIYPIEVKRGRPKTHELVQLEHIRDERWESGAVITLARSESVRLTKDWTLFHPYQLDDIFQQ